jgi:hypothetical protein
MPRCVFEDRARVNFKARTRVEQLKGPEGFTLSGPFSFWRVNAMRLSRDWWAVIVAALAVVLVKLGLVSGVPW